MVFALEREWMQRCSSTGRRTRAFTSASTTARCRAAPTIRSSWSSTASSRSWAAWTSARRAGTTAATCAVNPLRLSRGRPQKPYHDVQAYLDGPRARGRRSRTVRGALAARRRRCRSSLPAPSRRRRASGCAERCRSAPSTRRAQPHRPACPTARPSARSSTSSSTPSPRAERLIYIETQYFSSRRICEALLGAMRATERPRLEIVVVVNERAEALKEEIAVGLRQAQNLELLRAAAAETGHALGLYYTRVRRARTRRSAPPTSTRS